MTSTSAPDEVSHAMGVTSNTAEDFAAFTSALSVNGITCCICLLAFSILRLMLPRVYSNNALDDSAPAVSKTVLGWIRDGFVSTEDVIQHAGLDCALMLEFFTLSRRMMFVLCIPLLGVLCPLHYFYGGGAAGADKLESIGMGNVVKGHAWLYYVHAGMVWYVCVVLTSMIHRAQARFLKLRFDWLLHLQKPRATTVLVENIPLEYRSDARLREFFSAVFSPEVVEEARTVRKSAELARLHNKRTLLRQQHRQAELQREAKRQLVISGAEGMNAPIINGTYLPKGELNGRQLFRKWGAPGVWLAYIQDHWQVTSTRLKDLSRNGGWCVSMEANLLSPVDATAWRKFNGPEDGWEEQESISASFESPSTMCSCLRPKASDGHRLASQLEKLDQTIREEKARITDEAAEIGGVNSQSGFVRFRSRNYAEMALNLRYSANKDEWKVSVPPVASDVIWSDLVRGPHAQAILKVVGYAILTAIFFGFMAMVGLIGQGASAIHGLGPLQPTWDGLAPTIGLQIMLAVLPMLFVSVFRVFFTLKADAWSQHFLQSWYFWFQVVYVILVAAIGASLLDSLTEIAQEPLSIFSIAAEKLPSRSHFYMNFVVLQWTVNAKGVLRVVNLAQFLFYRNVLWEEERKARELADPVVEDTGARSATFTIIVLIGIIFSTISPLIALLVLMNSALCRCLYGYLLVYSEPKKADLGGAFWVRQLKHLHAGICIYCVLMIGMLADRAPSAPERVLEYVKIPPIPLLVAVPSLVYILWSYSTFKTKYDWETVPFNELVCREDTSGELRGEQEPYIQPELVDDADVPSQMLEADSREIEDVDVADAVAPVDRVPFLRRFLAWWSCLCCATNAAQVRDQEFSLLPTHEPTLADEESSSADSA
eukprot:TRINITY_DN32121_c0_g1_i1.p1 TRINITY_DN32121_c0_g1~~TRINITY_DN32121_c0_g1_i1.p1  ORF type:complete len:882 (-),score=85.94 TRINITY_DN32121_c0_g1_i1:56-2701(-)